MAPAADVMAREVVPATPRAVTHARVAFSNRSLVDGSFIRTYDRTLVLFKPALAGVTLVLLASTGGGFVLVPALLPLHLWAANRSGRFGQAAWAVAAGTGLAMTAWVIVYRVVGEHRPLIWLLPGVTGLAGIILFLRACGHERLGRAPHG